MPDAEKQSKRFGSKRVFGYIKKNPHMAVSVGLFLCGGGALARSVAPLAGWVVVRRGRRYAGRLGHRAE